MQLSARLQAVLTDLATSAITLNVVDAYGLALAHDPSIIKLSLRVRNSDRTGTFIARAVSEVENVLPPGYHPGNLAWEGSAKDTITIYGEGGIHDIVVAHVDRSRRKVRFIGPESVYTQPGQQQVGMEVEPTADHITFTLQVRETKRETGTQARILVHFDSNGYPRLALEGGADC